MTLYLGRPSAPSARVEHVADLDSEGEELLARISDIGDDQVQGTVAALAVPRACEFPGWLPGRLTEPEESFFAAVLDFKRLRSVLMLV